MQRIITLVGACATVGVLALVVLNLVKNPVEPRRAQLHNQLAEIQPRRVDVGPLGATVDIDAIKLAITGKPSLWKELVSPPPPPPPPPKEPPKLAEMLAGVQPTRQQIGSAIRIIVPNNPRGERYSVGDKINGVTITEITPTAVHFEYEWEGQTLTHKLPRS